MPLTKKHLPEGLAFANGELGTNAHPLLSKVSGRPTFDPMKKAPAEREAFAALCCAGLCSGEGRGEQVWLGEDAVQFLYGRNKRGGEQDCDVIARVMRSAEYGYVLGEGKGADIGKAKEQLDTACRLLAAHATQPGPVWGAVVVMSGLKYVEWNVTRKRWVVWGESGEDGPRTEDLHESAALWLQKDYIYLLDVPDDARDERKLSRWCIQHQNQPFGVWTHQRTEAGQRGSFRPLRVGQGQLKIYYVAH